MTGVEDFQNRVLAWKIKLAVKLKVSVEFVDFLVWNLIILYFIVVVFVFLA